MKKLKGSDRKYLRKLAHHLDPIVFVGKQGITDTLVAAVDEALTSHELIKLKFINQKDNKEAIVAEIEERTESNVVGLVGNIATIYREHPEEEERKIHLPED